MFNAVFCLRNVFSKPSNSIIIIWIIPPCRLTVIMEKHNCPFNRGNSRFWKKQKKNNNNKNKNKTRSPSSARHFCGTFYISSTIEHFLDFWAKFEHFFAFWATLKHFVLQFFTCLMQFFVLVSKLLFVTCWTKNEWKQTMNVWAASKPGTT